MNNILHTVLNEKKHYFKYLLLVFLGFSLSMSVLFGKLSPFSAALVGSLSGFDCLFAFLGSAVGFAVNNKMEIADALPNMIAMLAIGAFRIFVGKNDAPWVGISSSVLTGACVLFTTLITASKPSEIVLAASFGIIAGITCYSLILFYRVMSSERLYTLLKPTNTAALGIVCAFFTAALCGYEIIIFNLGIIFSALLTLTFANKNRYAGSAVAGTISAFGIGVANPDYIAGALIICAAGLVSALFVRLGKLTQTAGFIMAAGLGAALFGINTYTLNTIAGVFVGSLLYIILPMDKLTDKFRRPPQKSGAEASEIFAERLKLTGAAMGDVRLAIDKTAEILDKRSGKNIQWVYTSASDVVCKKCRHNMKCWGDEYNETAAAMVKLTKELRKGVQLKHEHLPQNISERCGKKEQLVYALNMQYREYTDTKTADRKISEMREVLTTQLAATESMMLQIAEEFESSANFDRVMASKTERILSEYGIEKPKAAVMVSDGRISVEAYGRGKLLCEAEVLCDRIAAALRHEFDLPDIVNGGREFRMSMFERAVYSVEYGVCQVSRDSRKNSGDYYDSFVDGKGYAYIILSDGMGSGGRARIDSAFACGMLVKLLRVGVSIEASIEMINNSLLVKSADESFATLDVCKIDLYSGKVILYKAGGAPTYIKNSKRIVKANGRGLPVGIKHKPVYEQQSFTIGSSDVVIMTSDGAELSERWLEHELGKEEYVKSSMEDIAEKIAAAAKFTEEKGREDDISVIAVKLVK